MSTSPPPPPPPPPPVLESHQKPRERRQWPKVEVPEEKTEENQPTHLIVEDYTYAHGQRGEESWQMPSLERYSNQKARLGYITCLAHEYLDVEDVFQAKVSILASMIRESSNFVVFGGAGLSTSTAAGIHDYASKAEDSLSNVEHEPRGIDSSIDK